MDDPHTTALFPLSAHTLVSPTIGIPFEPIRRVAMAGDAHSATARITEGRNIIFRQLKASSTCQQTVKMTKPNGRSSLRSDGLGRRAEKPRSSESVCTYEFVRMKNREVVCAHARKDSKMMDMQCCCRYEKAVKMEDTRGQESKKIHS